MFKKLMVSGCMTLLALGVFSNLRAQSTPSSSSIPRSTISGFVYDQNRRPVARVYVELLSDFNSLLRRVKTDDSGHFFFSGISTGRFTIKVNPTGTNFEEQSEDVEISGIGARGRPLADNIQKDVFLHPRKSLEGIAPKKGTIYVQEVPDAAKQSFEAALVNINNNQIDIAEVKLKAALTVFPEYYMALEKLCRIYIDQQKFEEAVKIAERMTTVNQRSFNGFYMLGYANFALHKPETSVDAFRRAISLDTSSVDATFLLGLSLRLAKNYVDSEKFLKQADVLAKGALPDIHWNLALLYSHNLNRNSDAANELELYLKLKPDVPNKEQILKLIKRFRESPST